MSRSKSRKYANNHLYNRKTKKIPKLVPVEELQEKYVHKNTSLRYEDRHVLVPYVGQDVEFTGIIVETFGNKSNNIFDKDFTVLSVCLVSDKRIELDHLNIRIPIIQLDKTQPIRNFDRVTFVANVRYYNNGNKRSVGLGLIKSIKNHKRMVFPTPSLSMFVRNKIRQITSHVNLNKLSSKIKNYCNDLPNNGLREEFMETFFYPKHMKKMVWSRKKLIPILSAYPDDSLRSYLIQNKSVKPKQ